jgi:hypothetical protein
VVLYFRRIYGAATQVHARPSFLSVSFDLKVRQLSYLFILELIDNEACSS